MIQNQKAPNLNLTDFTLNIKNPLLQAKYGYSLLHQKIIFYAISQATLTKEIQRKFTIPIDEISDFSNKSYTEIYKFLKSTGDNLLQLLIRIETKPNRKKEADKYQAFQWFISFEVEDKGRFISLEFNPNLIPYLEDFRTGNFTQLLLAELLNFKSIYAMRLYTLIRMHWNLTRTSPIEFSIEDIREILDLENTFLKFSAFRDNVLTPTKVQVNKFTDIDIEFKPTTGARKKRLDFLEIHITEKKKTLENVTKLSKINPGQPAKEEFELNLDLIFEIATLGIKKDKAIEILQTYTEEKIKAALEETATKASTNPAGYLLNCLERPAAPVAAVKSQKYYTPERYFQKVVAENGVGEILESDFETPADFWQAVKLFQAAGRKMYYRVDGVLQSTTD